MDEDKPFTFTWHYDPDVTRQYEAIIDAHFASNGPFETASSKRRNPTISQAKANLAAIQQQLKDLKQQITELRSTEENVRGLSDQQRVELIQQLRQQMRNVETFLSDEEKNKNVIRRLVLRRQHKRRAIRNNRSKKLELKLKFSQLESTDVVTTSTPILSDLQPAPKPIQRSSKRKTLSQRNIDEANSYLLLFDRLAELHRVRSQQATRPPDATFLAELASLETLWREALRAQSKHLIVPEQQQATERESFV